MNVIDIVDDLPQLFSSNNGTQSLFFGQEGVDNTPGLAQLDLRGLGGNRTLVLVDGKRHVSGQAGTAVVDVGSIHSALIERVEVLTGGASSIYGPDAVSGVVNFILKEHYEGTEIDAFVGVTGEGDSEEVQITFTHGRNFFNDRLNVTVNATVRRRDEITFGDRDWSENSGIAFIQESNWRRFFQRIDSLPPGALVGDAITTTDAGGNCIAAIPGTDPGLVSRACNARPSSIERRLRFGLTAEDGLIAISLADDPFAAVPTRAAAFPAFHSAVDAADLAPGTPFMDFDNNGIDDCDESVVGAFGNWVGGCVVIDRATGNFRPFDPGLVDGTFTNFNAVGGDGSPQSGAYSATSLAPEVEQYSFNARLTFELNDTNRLFADLKYITSDTDTVGGTIAFEDTINISPQNPFVPQPLADLLNSILALNPQFANTAQFHMSRDPTGDIHDDGVVERETFRIVAGLKGDFWDSWTYELAFNYGKTEEEARDQALLLDRYYAALDVVADASGNPVCRSEVDPTWTIDDFNSGSIEGPPAVTTFTPGDGSCRPANPFGFGNISRAAQDWIAPFRVFDSEIEQTVVSFIVTGDTERWFSLPAGAIGLAGGAEYRKEESDARPDAFEQAGYYFLDQTSPVRGDYDVTELFIEASMPLLADVRFAEELTVDGAYRYSDYNLDVGATDSWSFGFSWAPIGDIRFRGTVSRAVRAPNIFELFGPQTQQSFPLDIEPCDVSAIAALTDPVVQANRTANCAADVGPNFMNPLTSFFTGLTGGNPLLIEETSDTTTIGAVITPRFIPGLTLTVDWWDIEIEDAIQELGSNDVVNGCYDGPALDPTFCDLFTRVSDPTSGFFGGLNFLQTGQVNFAALETSGVDFEAVYDMELFAGGLTLRLNLTYLDELEEFRSATNPNLGDIDTGEMQRPEWAGNFNARYTRGALTVNYHMRYLDEQTHSGVGENLIASFDNALTDNLFIHDISATFEINDRYKLYGGIQNFTDEEPFATQVSFPTGPRGLYGFFGINVRL